MRRVMIMGSDRRPCLSSGNVKPVAVESAIVRARALWVGRDIPNAPGHERRIAVVCGEARRIKDNPPYLRARVSCSDRRSGLSVCVSILSSPTPTGTEACGHTS